MAAGGIGRWRVWAFGLVLLTLLAGWSVLLHQAENSVFSRVPLLDERQYLESAWEISSNGRQGLNSTGRPFFMSPLYPRVLNVLGVTTDPDELVVSPRTLLPLRIFQVLLWLATLILLRLLAGRLFARQTGPGSAWLWLPSFLFLLYGPLAVYTMMALVEMPLVFLLTLFLYLCTGQTRAWGRAILMGLVLGLAVLLRGSFLVLLPVGMLTLWLSSGPKRFRWLGLSAYLLAVLLVLAPAVWHNSRLTGQLSPPTLNGGLNLYLGNGPEATGLGAGFSSDWLADPAGVAELGRRLDRSDITMAEADGLWADQARKAMTESPLRVAGLWWRKIFLQIQGREMDQLTSLNGWRQEVPLLRILFLPWWALVIFAGVGLLGLADARSDSRFKWLVVVLLLLMGTQAVFFVVSRYRMVLVPIWCLLALSAGVQIRRWWSWKTAGWQRSSFLLPGVFLLTVFATIPWGMNVLDEVWQPLTVAHHAQRWALLGATESDCKDLEQSALLYEQSLARWPVQPEPYLGYAAVLRELDRPREADQVLQSGLERATPTHDLRRALVAAHLAAGRPDEGLVQARRLLAELPTDAETLHNLAVLLAGRNQVPEAVNLARQLVRAHPDLVQGYIDLGILLARMNRLDEARTVFQKGLEIAPGDPNLVENLNRIEGRK